MEANEEQEDEPMSVMGKGERQVEGVIVGRQPEVLILRLLQ